VRLSVLAPTALLLPLAAGCRLDFDRLPAMPGDAAPDVAPPAPIALPCGAPPQFPIASPGGGSTITLGPLAVAATDTDYYVLAADTAGDVHGFSYAFDGAHLLPRAIDAPVFSGATGAVAAIDTPDGVLAVMEYGRPNASGTALVPLDGQLASRGTPQMNQTWYGLDSTIARAADGTMALIGQQSSGAAAAKRVSPAGADLGASHLVVDSSEGVNSVAITAAGSRFLVTWGASAPSPNQVRAEIVDEQLGIVVPATTINPGAMFDGDNPRAGYAAAADRFLIAWSFKTSSGDELWVSLRDNQLAELHALRLSLHGVQPRIAAGKDDFLVAWKDTNMPSGIAAARVRFDGSFDSLVVSGSGSKALGWDLVSRAGQPALVWIEGSAAPSVWLDPLCN
jgi:hypothetical protein